jgi:hypothetical protein
VMGARFMMRRFIYLRIHRCRIPWKVNHVVSATYSEIYRRYLARTCVQPVKSSSRSKIP